MKVLILSVLATITFQSTAFATGRVIAQFNWGQESTDSQFSRSYQHIGVNLDESGLLDISVSEFTGFLPTDGESRMSHQLSILAFKSLKEDLSRLSTAKIKEYQSDIVCMVAVSPAIMINHLSVATEYDYDTDTFNGDLRLIMGAEGCWNHHHTFPESDHMAQQARVTKKILQILALDQAAALIR